MAESRLAIAALVVNAAIWGVSWWPFRELESRGLPVLWTTAFIYALGLCFLALVRFGPQSPERSDATNRSSQVVTGAWWPSLFALGVASGVTNASFNWAVTAGSVVRVVLLFYLMPVWAVLLARWLLNEPITRTALVRVGLALAGAMVVLWRPDVGMPLPSSLPDWLAILGGAAFALTNVLLRKAAHIPSRARALSMFGGTCLLVTAVAGVTLWTGVGRAPDAQVSNWLVLAIALAIAFTVSNLALQYGAARLPASVTAIVMLSELLFAALSSWVLGVETPSVPLLIGGTMIVAASWLAARGQ